MRSSDLVVLKCNVKFTKRDDKVLIREHDKVASRFCCSEKPVFNLMWLNTYICPIKQVRCYIVNLLRARE